MSLAHFTTADLLVLCAVWVALLFFVGLVGRWR